MLSIIWLLAATHQVIVACDAKTLGAVQVERARPGRQRARHEHRARRELAPEAGGVLEDEQVPVARSGPASG
jgi:hypothetical protein